MITAFNARRIRRKAKQITHENSRGVKDVARVLIAIQQKPLELTKDERLLRSIPTDNKWIEEILERLDRENAWTLATGSSVAWVVIAFLFTLIDSFISLNDSLVSLDDPGSGGYEGLAIGTLWLWLLCLVIGWLWVPIFSSSQIDGAIGHANSKAAETVKGMDEKEKEKEKQESIREGGTQVTEVTELGFNPDSSKSASSLQVPAESQQDHDRYSAGRTQTVQQSVTSVVRSAESQFPDSDGDKLLIPLLEIGSLHRDEFRHSATFNYARIMRYLALVDDVFRALGRVDVSVSGKCPMIDLSHEFSTEKGTYLPGHHHPYHVPSGSVRNDVQRGDFRPYSAVWSNRRSRDHHHLHPYRRFGVPFPGIHHLRRACYYYHVPHHDIDDPRSHIGNPWRQIPLRQRSRRFLRHLHPQDLLPPRLFQLGGVGRVILLPILLPPCQLLLQLECHWPWYEFLYRHFPSGLDPYDEAVPCYWDDYRRILYIHFHGVSSAP